jgi:hypothetical protein
MPRVLWGGVIQRRTTRVTTGTQMETTTPMYMSIVADAGASARRER